jgi:DNA-binding GntR family transcriptional regulator
MDVARRHLLRDQAYAALVRAIVHGELAPGDALRDVELAARLGLSRTPVREALTRLADEGLVLTKPNAYTRVAPIDERAAADAAVLNQSLHALAVRLACAAGTFGSEHAAAARRANRAFAAALRDGDLPSALAADHDVHDAFVVASGNAQVAAAIRRLAPLLRRHALARFASLPGRRSVDAHERIVAAAERGDTAAATQLTHDNWGTLVELVRPDPALADPPTDGGHRAAR